jgi:uncharacterized membrane protein
VTFVTVFVRTWFSDMNHYTLRGAAGMFGYLEVALPLWLDIIIFIAGAAYLWCYRRRVPDLARGERIFLAVWALFFIYVTYMALYIGWTAPGKSFIDGVQGRYLLPALLLALPAAPNIAKVSRRSAAVIFKGVPVALLVLSMVYIVERYYYTYLGEFASLQ